MLRQGAIFCIALVLGNVCAVTFLDHMDKRNGIVPARHLYNADSKITSSLFMKILHNPYQHPLLRRGEDWEELSDSVNHFPMASSNYRPYSDYMQTFPPPISSSFYNDPNRPSTPEQEFYSEGFFESPLDFGPSDFSPQDHVATHEGMSHTDSLDMSSCDNLSQFQSKPSSWTSEFSDTSDHGNTRQGMFNSNWLVNPWFHKPNLPPALQEYLEEVYFRPDKYKNLVDTVYEEVLQKFESKGIISINHKDPRFQGPLLILIGKTNGTVVSGYFTNKDLKYLASENFGKELMGELRSQKHALIFEGEDLTTYGFIPPNVVSIKVGSGFKIKELGKIRILWFDACTPTGLTVRVAKKAGALKISNSGLELGNCTKEDGGRIIEVYEPSSDQFSNSVALHALPECSTEKSELHPKPPNCSKPHIELISQRKYDLKDHNKGNDDTSEEPEETTTLSPEQNDNIEVEQ